MARFDFGDAAHHETQFAFLLFLSAKTVLFLEVAPMGTCECVSVLVCAGVTAVVLALVFVFVLVLVPVLVPVSVLRLVLGSVPVSVLALGSVLGPGSVH